MQYRIIATGPMPVSFITYPLFHVKLYHDIWYPGASTGRSFSHYLSRAIGGSWHYPNPAIYDLRELRFVLV